jgi:thiamine biosynthesis lipoprotein
MEFAGFLPPMPLQLQAASTDCGRVRRARPLLGTLVEIEVSADRTMHELHAAIDAGFGAIAQVHASMSYQNSGSELSRINKCAASGAQPVSPGTYAVLRAALEFARLSNGAFEPCVAPRAATWHDVELIDGESVRFLRPLRLDLGGIAKGFAVDAAVETLKRLDIDDILVNAGGDLRIAGGMARSIVLRDPRAPARPGHTLSVQDAALATSAAYYSRTSLGGTPISALIDGRSRVPYLGGRSVSVCAGNCMSADALTKIVLFAEPATAEYCLARFGATAYILGGL